jgi:hypothetical protein
MFFAQHPLFSEAGFGPMRFHVRQHRSAFPRRTTATSTHSSSTLGWLFQFLPLLFLFIMTYWNRSNTESALFAFDKTEKFSIERVVAPPIDVHYYVSGELMKNYGNNMNKWSRLEIKVKQTYYRMLEEQCQIQYTAKRRAMDYARYYGNKVKYEEASKRTLPSCERLQAFKNLPSK